MDWAKTTQPRDQLVLFPTRCIRSAGTLIGGTPRQGHFRYNTKRYRDSIGQSGKPTMTPRKSMPDVDTPASVRSL